MKINIRKVNIESWFNIYMEITEVSEQERRRYKVDSKFENKILFVASNGINIISSHDTGMEGNIISIMGLDNPLYKDEDITISYSMEERDILYDKYKQALAEWVEYLNLNIQIFE